MPPIHLCNLCVIRFTIDSYKVSKALHDKRQTREIHILVLNVSLQKPLEVLANSLVRKSVRMGGSKGQEYNYYGRYEELKFPDQLTSADDKKRSAAGFNADLVKNSSMSIWVKDFKLMSNSNSI